MVAENGGMRCAVPPYACFDFTAVRQSAGVPDDEQAKPAPDHDPGIAGGNTARVYDFDVARLTVPP